MLSALLLCCCRLLYKNDGNAVGRTCWLHIRRLQSDGLHFKGPEKLLIRNDLPWEGAVIEVRQQTQLCCSKGLFRLYHQWWGQQTQSHQ